MGKALEKRESRGRLVKGEHKGWAQVISELTDHIGGGKRKTLIKGKEKEEVNNVIYAWGDVICAQRNPKKKSLLKNNTSKENHFDEGGERTRGKKKRRGI